MEIKYKTPEIILVDMFERSCPLCASTGCLPDMEESDDMGNLGWN